MLVRLDHAAVSDLTHFRIFSRNLAPDFTHYLSERLEMSSQDERSPKAKTRNKNENNIISKLSLGFTRHRRSKREFLLEGIKRECL